MIGVSSRISASFSQNYTVNLFQSASVSQTNENGTNQANVSVAGTFSGPAARAIDSIIQIVMNANGDASVGVETDGAVIGASTGDGNDDINIQASRAYLISSGTGDDTINIESTGSGGAHRHGNHHHGSAPAVMGVNAGEGNDTVNISAKGGVSIVGGGGGNDTIDIDAGGPVRGIFGGDGNDTVSIASDRDVGFVGGGAGNDTIDIDARGNVAFVNGGEGNDTINIEGSNIDLVAGGTGNDTIQITNNGDRASQYYYFEGDGNDTISSNGPVEINLFSEDGTSRQDIANASWEQDGNTVTISFADGGSIAVTIEDASNAGVSYNADKGTLVIGPAEAASSGATINIESGVSVSA